MKNEDKTVEKLKYEKPAAVKFQFANDDVILASGGDAPERRCLFGVDHEGCIDWEFHRERW